MTQGTVSESKRVLLIGGSGFLIGTVARPVAAAGHSVWAITCGRCDLPAGVMSLVADHRDRGAFEGAVSSPGTG